MRNTQDAEPLLREVRSFNLCSGCGLKPLNTTLHTSNGLYFAKNCSLVSDGACIACRYLQKLTQNQLSRKKNTLKPGMRDFNKHARTLRLVKQKLSKIHKVVQAMKTRNEQLSRRIRTKNNWTPAQATTCSENVLRSRQTKIREGNQVHRRVATGVHFNANAESEALRAYKAP